jgi:RNA polymerase sigma factor (sigma-70 family)
MTVGTKQMPGRAASDIKPAVAQSTDVAGSIGVDSDESLALRLRGGDSAAGDELVTRYHPALIRYLHRLAGSDHMAEELHQQTWLSVLDHIERFDPASSPGGFKAWLFRIATNKTNDHWRSRGREKAATEGLKLVTDEELPGNSALTGRAAAGVDAPLLQQHEVRRYRPDAGLPAEHRFGPNAQGGAKTEGFNGTVSRDRR